MKVPLTQMDCREKTLLPKKGDSLAKKTFVVDGIERRRKNPYQKKKKKKKKKSVEMVMIVDKKTDVLVIMKYC